MRLQWDALPSFHGKCLLLQCFHLWLVLSKSTSRGGWLFCGSIRGDLTAHFNRSDLHLARIAGKIDVHNEFGDTTFDAKAQLSDNPHRLISESGRIEVTVSRPALGQLPLQAWTHCGSVRAINANSSQFEEANISGQSDDGTTRGWRGMKTPSPAAGGLDIFNRLNRIQDTLAGRNRAPGLDLISRCGPVVVTLEK